MEQQNTGLSDKAFVRLILTSVLGILFCAVCLCSTTYAWFTGSVQGNSNIIQTADSCNLSVSVFKDGKEPMTVTVENARTLENAEGEYAVTLTLPMGSASGYLVISAGGKEYYSDYLQRNNEEDQALTFTLNVETTQNVTFTARWGIYSGESDLSGGQTLNIA